SSILSLRSRLPPRSTPFPYTTLFRSVDGDAGLAGVAELGGGGAAGGGLDVGVVKDDQRGNAAQFERDPLQPVGRAAHDLAAHFRSEEHTSELQSRSDLVCRLLLEKKK